MKVHRDDVIKFYWRYFPIINVDFVAVIPSDYPGLMGVPITYMDKHTDRFEIVGIMTAGNVTINGKHPYSRIVIRNLRPDIPKYVDIDKMLSKAYGRDIRAENIIGIAAGKEYTPIIEELENKYGWYDWWKIVDGKRRYGDVTYQNAESV